MRSCQYSLSHPSTPIHPSSIHPSTHPLIPHLLTNYIPETFKKHTLLLILSIFMVSTTTMKTHKSVTPTLSFIILVYRTNLVGYPRGVTIQKDHPLIFVLWKQGNFCIWLCSMMWGGRWSFPKSIIQIKEKGL